MTTRPPLFDALVLRVPKPWAPGTRLVLEVRGVRNVNGVAGSPVGVVAVPEKPKVSAADSLKAKRHRDSTRVREPTRQPSTPPRK